MVEIKKGEVVKKSTVLGCTESFHLAQENNVVGWLVGWLFSTFTTGVKLQLFRPNQ